MAKKHVLIDIRPLLNKQVSGVQVYTQNLLKALKADKSNKYTLYCNSFGKPDFSQLEKDFSIKFTRIPNKLFNLLLRLELIKIDKLIKEKFDIILCPDLRPAHFSKHIKKIQVIHDFSFIKHKEFFSKKTRLWFKLLNPGKEIKKSTRIVSVSKSTAKEYKTLFKRGPAVQVIPPFIKQYGFKAKNTKKRFLYIGTIEPRKNIEALVSGFKEFHKENKEYTLLIAGGENRQIFKEVKKEEHPAVKWLGTVSEAQKEKLLAESRALVYLSKYEGFGLPLAEAISIGTPCIISNVAALKETAADCALISKDEKELMENMQKLIKDEKTYRKLKNNCKVQKKKWNSKLTLQKWLKLFKDI